MMNTKVVIVVDRCIVVNCMYDGWLNVELVVVVNSYYYYYLN